MIRITEIQRVKLRLGWSAKEAGVDLPDAVRTRLCSGSRPRLLEGFRAVAAGRRMILQGAGEATLPPNSTLKNNQNPMISLVKDLKNFWKDNAIF